MKEDLEKVNNSRYSMYNKVTNFIMYSRKYILSSIPKVHADIRIKLTDRMYSLSSNMFYATYNKGNVRMKYLVELQVDISMIDMLFDILKKENIVKKHSIDVAISDLGYIKNIVYGWKFNEEKGK